MFVPWRNLFFSYSRGDKPASFCGALGKLPPSAKSDLVLRLVIAVVCVNEAIESQAMRECLIFSTDT